MKKAHTNGSSYFISKRLPSLTVSRSSSPCFPSDYKWNCFPSRWNDTLGKPKQQTFNILGLATSVHPGSVRRYRDERLRSADVHAQKGHRRRRNDRQVDHLSAQLRRRVLFNTGRWCRLASHRLLWFNDEACYWLLQILIQLELFRLSLLEK